MYEFTPTRDAEADNLKYKPFSITDSTQSTNTWKNALNEDLTEAFSFIFQEVEHRRNSFDLSSYALYNFLKELKSDLIAHDEQGAPHPVIACHLSCTSGTSMTFWPYLEIYVPGISSKAWQMGMPLNPPPMQKKFQNMGDYITSTKANQYLNEWNGTPKTDLPGLFWVGEPWNERVTYYQYTEADTVNFFNNAMGSEFGTLVAHLILGSGAPEQHELTVHPVSFRPVLCLYDWVDGNPTSRAFWDYSNPCPPNCR